MKSLHWNAVALTALAAAGLQSAQAQSKTGGASTRTGQAAAVKVPQQIMPYMVVAIGPTATSSDDNNAATRQNGQAEVAPATGGYTRLELSYQPPAQISGQAGTVRTYDKERRDAIRRWLAGKSITRVLAVKAALAKPKLTTTTTVASVGRESNSKVGETWNTELNSRRVMTPFFRIDPGAAITLGASFTLNSSYDASAAKAVLDVIRQGAKLVAPTASLVTSLNEDRFKDASDFIDNSIRNLLRESIVEKTDNDFVLSEWAGQDLMAIQLFAPMGNEITPGERTRSDQQPVELGTWTVRSAPPILSVFSTMLWTDPSLRSSSGGKKTAATSLCNLTDALEQRACLAFKDLDPQTVLNFAVDDNVSVAQALAGEQAIVAARDELVKSKAEAAAGPAQTLCGLITDKAQRLGFNRFDVAAIVWAYASQSNLKANAGAMRDKANCGVLALAYSVGLPVGNFSTAS